MFPISQMPMNARLPVVLLGAISLIAFTAPGYAEPENSALTSSTDTPPKPDPFLEKLKAAMTPRPSPALTSVETLARSGVSEEVLMSYIKNSPDKFAPRPEDILRLREAGLTDRAMVSLIEHSPQPLAVATAAPLQPVESSAQPTQQIQQIVTTSAPQVIQIVDDAYYVAEPTVILSSPRYVTPAPVYVQQSPNVIWVPTSWSGSWSRRLSTTSYSSRGYRPSYSGVIGFGRSSYSPSYRSGYSRASSSRVSSFSRSCR